jgi:hypothetical protein
MAGKLRPFNLRYEYTEVPDVEERLDRIFAILLAAADRAAQEEEADSSDRHCDSAVPERAGGG